MDMDINDSYPGNHLSQPIRTVRIHFFAASPASSASPASRLRGLFFDIRCLIRALGRLCSIRLSPRLSAALRFCAICEQETGPSHSPAPAGRAARVRAPLYRRLPQDHEEGEARAELGALRALVLLQRGWSVQATSAAVLI